MLSGACWRRVQRIRATLAETATATLPDEERKDKEQRRQVREAAKTEFRVNYTRAFPSWVFYFDLDQHDPDTATLRNSLVSRVSQLGARAEDFFSNEITHLITNQASAEQNDSQLSGVQTKMQCILPSPRVSGL